MRKAQDTQIAQTIRADDSRAGIKGCILNFWFDEAGFISSQSIFVAINCSVTAAVVILQSAIHGTSPVQIDDIIAKSEPVMARDLN